jgi:alpha/beta hydrolase fold/WD40-like Beta Propeller Repeat
VNGPIRTAACVAALVVTQPLLGCSDTSPPDEKNADPSRNASPTATEPSEPIDGLFDIGDGRSLYVRCTGSGSPTVILEAGDDDPSASYDFAVPAVSAVTRACVYDRANLGRSDPDPGPRGLAELVGDFENLIEAADIPGPYVLVGTSGGGYISAGYAVEHPEQMAGMVFVEVPAPFWNPPQEIVEATRWDSPVNVENRDYLQVEKDAWAARRRVGEIPVTVISNEYSPEEIAAAEFPEEAAGMPGNVQAQRGWLVLSPLAEQVVVHTGHAVEEADPALVRDAILDVVEAARIEPTTRIVFKRLEADVTTIYAVNPDGSRVTQLFAEEAEGARWSPDGTEIAILCCGDGMAAHLLNAETGALRTLPMPDPSLETFCAGPWSPDGQRLTCEGFSTDEPDRKGIYSIRASDGGDLRRITSFLGGAEFPDGSDLPGDYSPDGEQLLFVRTDRVNTPGLFVTNLDGTGLRRIAPESLLIDDSGGIGRWSPNGEQILFVARSAEDHHKAFWVVDPRGGSPEQLPITPACGGPISGVDEFGCYSPGWSPDGEKIVFVRFDGAGESIYTVNADGSGLTQITDGEDDQPDWTIVPAS